MSEWKKVKFMYLFSEPTKNGIYKTKEFHGKGAKIINMGEVFAYSFLGNQKMSRVDINDKERVLFLVKNGDLLFARRSLVESGAGKCAIVANIIEETTFESSIIRVRLDEKVAMPLFYMYWMRSLAGRTAINAIVNGVNVKGIRSSDLQNIEVDLPLLSTQQRIASILSRYDSLIENYQKQIKLLEEAAQRLYKEWFVDLHFPGHENIKIVDGVPEGWEKKKISEVGTVVTGKTPSTVKKENYGGNIPFITIPDMHLGIYPVCSQKLSEIGANSQYNKFIPQDSLMVSCIGTAGLVCISKERCQTNQQINSLVLTDKNMLYYMFFTLKQLKEHLNNIGSNGATMTNVSKSKFEGIEVIIPQMYLIGKFNQFAENEFTKIKNLSSQIRILTEARDRLLPKLMSGEIAV